jgi:eukaryotic-like serine/threonine-protein kinase
VVDVLGEGAMGIVYAAVDDRLDRPVALKVLRAAYAENATSRERFWREARLAARVSHPHICQLHDVGEQHGQLFLAMERLEGESLAARLQGGAMPIGDAVPIAIDVLTALDVLHRHGIIHRDLKPSNVFLTANGAKLLDFGVAKTDLDATAPTELPLTDAGTLVGTPRYMGRSRSWENRWALALIFSRSERCCLKCWQAGPRSTAALFPPFYTKLPRPMWPSSRDHRLSLLPIA